MSDHVPDYMLDQISENAPDYVVDYTRLVRVTHYTPCLITVQATRPTNRVQLVRPICLT